MMDLPADACPRSAVLGGEAEGGRAGWYRCERNWTVSGD